MKRQLHETEETETAEPPKKRKLNPSGDLESENTENNDKTKKENDKNTFELKNFTFNKNFKWGSSFSKSKDQGSADGKEQKSGGFAGFSGLGFAKKSESQTEENSPSKWQGWGENKENGEKANAKGGGFKLNFNWQDKDFQFKMPAGVDFNKKKYKDDDDPEQFKTDKPIDGLKGQAVDTGDSSDMIHHSCEVKIYKFDKKENRYVEKGKGTLCVNTFVFSNDEQKETQNNNDKDNSENNKEKEKEKTKDNKEKENTEKRLKGRLLCRREKTMQTLLNLPLTADTTFEKLNDTYWQFKTLETEIVTENDTKTNKIVPHIYLIRPVVPSNLTSLGDAITDVIKKIEKQEFPKQSPNSKAKQPTKE